MRSLKEIEEEMNEKERMCGEISGKGAAREDLWGLWRGWRRENGNEGKKIAEKITTFTKKN